MFKLAVTLFGVLQLASLPAELYSQKIRVHVPQLPSLFTLNGIPSCYYELHVANFSEKEIELKQLQIVNDNATGLIVFEKQNLQGRFSLIGHGRNDSFLVINSGVSGVIYVELASSLLLKTEKLEHRLTIKQKGKHGTDVQVVSGYPVELKKNGPLVVGAPLSKGMWTAIYDPSWQRGHRRVIYTLNGTARIPGRFAIDFIQMDKQGQYARGDENIITNWIGYGADVLAVADGVVSSVNAGFVESRTLAEHPNYTPESATGNYISIKISDSVFAFYEHLKPGSIRVKQGQQVKKGEVIASLGFTGQTTGPHLHFHLADRDSPLGAEGIPFTFEHFTYIGVYNQFEHFGKQVWAPTTIDNPLRQNERPASNAVIIFNTGL